MQEAKENPARHYVVKKLTFSDGTVMDIVPSAGSSNLSLPFILTDTFYDNARVHFFCSDPRLEHVPVAGGTRAKGTAMRLAVVHQYVPPTPCLRRSSNYSYNDHMDSIDTFDHIKVLSTPKYSFRRWPLKFFFSVLLSIVESNAFIIYRRLCEIAHKADRKSTRLNSSH